MADYIYLLENRLSPAQRSALRTVRELARSKNLTVFLVGGAVRDLTSGSPVRDLDVVVQGNALKLKADLEKAGAVITGEITAAQSLFAAFPGSVRVEIGSTLSVTWPKPGKPVYKSASILDDLRRRDFTANAMALSLNEGSYGLLMDPLNGVADIENRELRLVSNYGFIEDPVRMVRAARLMARLGWALDEKTQQRYENGKAENYIAALTDQQRGYELEEIIHEEDPYRVLTRLEAEGWLPILAPYWTAAKVDVPALEHLRDLQTQLQVQGIYPDASAANFPLLTARLSAKDVATLKSSFVRQGFVKEIESLDQKAKDLANLLTSKAATLPSQTWQLLTSAAPEAVLWVAYSSKSSAIQAKLKNFFTVWPQAKQKIPYALMQEMRIVPELPGYEELVGLLFFELMDDKLQTPEELKAFLEPYSPPAPPPPVSTRKPRAAKKDAKGKGRGKKAIAVDLDDESEDDGDGELPDEIEEVLDEALDEPVEADIADDASTDDAADDSDDEPESKSDEPPPVKTSSKPASKPAAKPAAKPAPLAVAKPVPLPAPPPPVPEKHLPSKSAPAPVKAAPVKQLPAKSLPVKQAAAKKPAAKPSPPAKSAKAAAVAPPSSRRPLASAKPAKKSTPTKPVAKKASSKALAKPPAKPAKKAAPPVKIAARKTAPPAKKAVAKKVPAKKSAPAKAPAKKQSPARKSASKKSVPAKKRR
jgi:tRNA nucleotidyltransferase/poly(A) polymerase